MLVSVLNSLGGQNGEPSVCNGTRPSILLISRLPVHGKFLSQTLSNNYVVYWVGKNFNSTLGLLNALFILFSEFMHGIRIFKKARYPLVLVQFVSLDGIVALILRRIFRSKVVFFAIGTDILKIRMHSFLYPLMRFLVLRSDFVFCANSLIKCELVAMGLSESKMAVIGSVVTFEDFEGSSASKSFDIISVGNLDVNKDHLSLIRACELMGPVKVCLIGEGPLRGMLEVESQKRGVDVRFLGNVPRKSVLREMQKAKVYVHTAKSEGLPVSFLEAIFCGLPLVVVNYPYVKDILKRVDFKFNLVEVGSPGALAHSVQRVLQNYGSELINADLNCRTLLSFLDQNASQIKTSLDKLIKSNNRFYGRSAK